MIELLSKQKKSFLDQQSPISCASHDKKMIEPKSEQPQVRAPPNKFF
jgi:hypothetical protein